MEGNACKPRLLLVEDEDALRSTLRLNFELEGYDVTTAVTGPDALQRLRGARYDVVVMDVMLPGMAGFTVVETIRLEGNATPVLFLTARAGAPDRIRGLKAGEDHLAKPFELEELLLRVAKLVDRSNGKVVGTVLESFTFGDNEVDFQRYEVKGQGGLRKTLSQREMML